MVDNADITTVYQTNPHISGKPLQRLRAPARCTTVPQGASEASYRGASLKLAVVRRNGACQSGILLK